MLSQNFQNELYKRFLDKKSVLRKSLNENFSY